MAISQFPNLVKLGHLLKTSVNLGPFPPGNLHLLILQRYDLFTGNNSSRPPLGLNWPKPFLSSPKSERLILLTTTELWKQTRPTAPDILSHFPRGRTPGHLLPSGLPPYTILAIFPCDHCPAFPSIPHSSICLLWVPTILPWLTRCCSLSTSSLKISLTFSLNWSLPFH